MKKKAYIVEDHRDLREILAAYVESRPDVEVCGTASSAEIALTEIPTLDPDIALIDVSMPGIDGIELVRRLRNLRLHLKIIMLSGHFEPPYVEAALKAGAQAYVPKGNVLALSKALQDVLGNGGPEASPDEPSPAPR